MINDNFLPQAEFMYQLFRDGLLGTKEYRNWLAEYDEVFAKVRDADVDNEIDELARRKREALDQLLENAKNSGELSLISREGQIKELT